MIVYGSTLSPFVRKVVVLAHEKGMTFELKVINRGSSDPDFRSASPLGKMPALRDGDFTLADSTAIAFYMDEVGPGAALIPSGAKERSTTIWWDEFADTELFGCLRPMFFNRIVSPLFLRVAGDETAALAGERQLPAILDYLDRALPDPGRFLVGDRLTLADIAMTSPIVNLLHLDRTLDAYPRANAWFETILARPSFATLIEKERATIARARAR